MKSANGSSQAIAAAAALLALASTARGQHNIDGRVNVAALSQPYVFLIRDPVVHQDLGLEPRQVAAIKSLTDQLDPRIWSVRNKPTAQATPLVEKFTADAQAGVKTILTAAQQRRLLQVQLWVRGFQSLTADSVASHLELTDQQRREITAVLRETHEGMLELQKKAQAGEDRSALEAQASKIQSSQQNRLTAILTQTQRSRWIQLLGKRVDVSKLGRVTMKAPALAPGEWINSQPLTMSDLKGKVVALHFYAFG